MELSAIIEALLIASEQPLASNELARLVRARVAEAEEAVNVENEDAAEGTEQKSLPEEIAKLASTSQAKIIAAIATLNQDYDNGGRAFTILERSKGWKIFTRPDYADFVRQLFPGKKPQRLSGPAMETLAIIAYRQPITKASMEAVRGVSCDGMLQKLLDRELIFIGGRAELPGRPLLYQTTDLFFEYFGIKTVDDLPNSAELRTVKLPEPKPEDEPEAELELEEKEPKQKNDFDAASIESQIVQSATDQALSDHADKPTDSAE